jgi:ribosome-associated protein
MLILFLVTLLNKIIINQQKIVQESIDILLAQNCFNIQSIELSQDPFSDFLLLATARSQTQLSASIYKLKDYYKSNEISSKSEGESTSWALIAAEDILINILTEEARLFYSLEDLYFDCKITTIHT